EFVPSGLEGDDAGAARSIDDEGSLGPGEGDDAAVVGDRCWLSGAATGSFAAGAASARALTARAVRRAAAGASPARVASSPRRSSAALAESTCRGSAVSDGRSARA